jgi:hypothetical protein
MLSTLRSHVSSGIVRGSPRGTNMLALASAAQGQNPTLILLIIAAVVVAAFWRTILTIGIAAVVIGFVFLLVTGLLEIVHSLHALIP